MQLFFLTNRQACDTWLNRIRLDLMRVALSSGSPAAAYQHGEAVLRDMDLKNNTQVGKNQN